MKKTFTILFAMLSLLSYGQEQDSTLKDTTANSFYDTFDKVDVKIDSALCKKLSPEDNWVNIYMPPYWQSNSKGIGPTFLIFKTGIMLSSYSKYNILAQSVEEKAKDVNCNTIKINNTDVVVFNDQVNNQIEFYLKKADSDWMRKIIVKKVADYKFTETDLNDIKFFVMQHL